MAFGFMKRISPEYVVENAIQDMRTAGLDGLKPYLTEAAEKKVETFRTVSSGVSLFTGGDKINVFFSRLSEFEWTINEILKGSDSAKAVMGFAIRGGADEIEGSIQLTMIKEEKEWRIDGVEAPRFVKFTVSNPKNQQ